jgi:hypothetical protein
MQPEGPPQDARGEGAAGQRPGDLTGRVLPLGDWGQPAQRLDELYRWVERGALEVAGAALPLLDMTGMVGGVAPWGYLALLLGVACVAGDRFFGVTSGWIRDVATAQAVQRRLQVLQFDWASESVREVLGPAEGTASEAADRCLGVLRRFAEDVTELVRVETADWMVEFRTGAAPLGIQSTVPVGQRPDAGVVHGRFPSPPGAGARPNMPRQRPPEPR